VSGQLHAPAALPPGKSSWYSLYRRLGGPQSRFGRHGEVIILDPTGTRTPTSQSSSPDLEEIVYDDMVGDSSAPDLEPMTGPLEHDNENILR
jgi:hypothetical protein